MNLRLEKGFYRDQPQKDCEGHRGIMRAARPILPSPGIGKLKHELCDLITEVKRMKIY